MQTFLLWVGTTVVLGILDFLWLGVFAKDYYKSQLGSLLAANVTWWAAGLLYLIYAAGIVFFVLQPALAAQSLSRALWTGFFFGLVCFAIYDLTNLATTANWPLAMSFVDLLYGAVVGALTSGVVYWLFTNFRF